MTKKRLFTIGTILLLLFPLILSGLMEPVPFGGPRQWKDENKDGIINLFDYVWSIRQIKPEDQDETEGNNDTGNDIDNGKEDTPPALARMIFPSSIAAWDEFILRVQLDELEGCVGASVDLSFNPDLFRVVEVIPGELFRISGDYILDPYREDIIIPDTPAGFLEIVQRIDNNKGTLHFAQVVSSARTGVRGGGTFAFIRMRAVGSAAYPLRFTDDPMEELTEETGSLRGITGRILLSNREGMPVRYDLENSIGSSVGFIRPSSAIPSSRLVGDSRYTTAVRVSQKGWDKSQNVVLVTGEDYVDALAGVPLAHALDAPVLMTPTSSLDPDTLKEIQRLKSSNIYVLGGRGAVSNKVTRHLENLGYNVERIKGSDRAQTARMIGDKVREVHKGDTVILTTGYSFPDALAAANSAARNYIPILFTNDKNLDLSVQEAIRDWEIQNVIIVGGEAVVSDKVKNDLEKLGLNVVRLSGRDRYYTALEVSRFFDDWEPRNNDTRHKPYKGIVMATAQDYADGLAGAALAARLDYAMLFSPRYYIQQRAIDYAKSLPRRPEQVYLVGGTGAIEDRVWFEVMDELNAHRR